MSEDRSPLDSESLALLRAKAAPSAGERARARARLALVIPGMGGSSGGGGGSAGGGSTGRAPPRLGGLGPHLVAIATFVLGGGTGAGLYALLSRPPPPAIVYVERPALPVPSAAILGAPAAEASNAATTALVASSPGLAPSASALPRPSQLAAERAVLDEARAALLQGEPGRSIEQLERHRRTFPRPLLGEERDAMWIEALAKLGRYDEVRVRADAFRRRRPASLFLPAVNSAVASIP